MSTAKERIARRRNHNHDNYAQEAIYIGEDPNHTPYQPPYEQDLELDIPAMSSRYVEEYNRIEQEFKTKTKLNGLDYKFLFLATALQIIRQQVFSNAKFRIDSTVGDKYKTTIKKKTLNITPEDMHRYVNIIFGQAPYDKILPKESGANIGGQNHRYSTLGHDPLGGWIFGTLNFITKTLTLKNLTLTTYDVSTSLYPEVLFSQIVHDGLDKVYEEPPLLPVCVLAQAVHLGSDVFTKCGLPLPILNNIPNQNEMVEKFLQKNYIDLYSVTRGAMMSEFINRCIFAIHSLFASPNDDNRLYAARTRKIIIYSGAISSTSNLIEVGLTKNFKKFDVGGILTAVWHFFTDQKYIRQLEDEFISQSLTAQVEAQIQELDSEIAFYEKKLGITI